MRHPIAVVLLLVSPAIAAAEDYPARVVGVSDGDTLTCLRDGRTQVKVRLFGIDAPESAQPFGTRAKQSLSDLAFGQVVTIQPRDVDRYGRVVAVVILPDGRNVNHEMVRQGMAWWYRQYAPRDQQLEHLEARARVARRGLWADRQSIPPWEWRKTPPGPPLPAGAVIGNRNSHVYHAQSCPSLRKMLPQNRVPFASAADAERAGYRKAGDCR